MPDGVYWPGGIIHSNACVKPCSAAPVYILRTDDSGAGLGSEGYLVSYGNDEDFEFLSDMGFKKFD